MLAKINTKRLLDMTERVFFITTNLMTINSKDLFTICQRFLRFLCVVFVLSCFFMFRYGHTKQLDLPTVSVLADPSLTVPLTHIARNYSAEHHALITMSYGSTADQSLKVEMGDEADIFISPQPRWIKHLTNQGVVDVYSRTALVKNRLVLVSAKDNPIELSLIKGIPLDDILIKVGGEAARLIVGDPQYLDEGSFALEALTFFGLLSAMEPLFEFPRSSVTMHETILEPGNLGLMYETEAQRNPAIKVIDTVPTEAHAPIVYEAVVIASKDMQPAREFLEYLKSGEALDIFQQYGFDKAFAVGSEH